MTKKRTWKFWTGRTVLALVVLGGLWLINLIWFKPFSINNFYEKVFVELVFDSPEVTTQLGIPVIYDWTKDELDDISDAKKHEKFSKLKEDYETLLSYDFEKQTSENKLNTKILKYWCEIGDEINGVGVRGESFQYHNYPVNQMGGIQNSLPNLLVNSHLLNDESDIEAYISRLSKFDIKFSQLIEGLKIRESKGVVPPKFINTIVLNGMKKFIGLEKDNFTQAQVDNVSAVLSNILYTNFENKINTIDNLSEDKKLDYKNQVAETIERIVFPAYNKLIDYTEELNKKASNYAGVWKLPNGDAYYRYQLKRQTTTDLEPEEVHQIGLLEVARIKSEMQNILLAEGYADSTMTISEIIQNINKEERFVYSNNDEGREMIIKDYTQILNEIKHGLGEAFNIQPKADLEVKRIPKFKEDASNGAYYTRPAMDGSRGGTFYANLRNVHETVKFGMKTLAYHEGIPGHHFQLALQSELQGLPTFRTTIPFTAYTEGWALYAEYLAWELGFYENDPFGNLGRLQAEMFRAARLVVDTGIHYKKWTREEAIDYMVLNTGMITTKVATEIERYIVMPGQACAYKIGMLKILELRERAKKKLGNQFDLKEFHNVVLKNGAIPLDVLEEIIDVYINNTLENKNS